MAKARCAGLVTSELAHKDPDTTERRGGSGLGYLLLSLEDTVAPLAPRPGQYVCLWQGSMSAAALAGINAWLSMHSGPYQRMWLCIRMQTHPLPPLCMAEMHALGLNKQMSS